MQDQAQRQYSRDPIPEIAPAQFRVVEGQRLRGLAATRGAFAVLESGTFDTNQTGFNQSTAVLASTDNGQTYVATISYPLPFGLERPAGAPGISPADGRRPYTQRWSATIQLQSMASSVLEIGYRAQNRCIRGSPGN